jgi:hypothetical protein
LDKTTTTKKANKQGESAEKGKPDGKARPHKPMPIANGTENPATDGDWDQMRSK